MERQMHRRFEVVDTGDVRGGHRAAAVADDRRRRDAEDAHRSASATWIAKFVTCASSGAATRDRCSSAASSSSRDQPAYGRSASSQRSISV